MFLYLLAAEEAAPKSFWSSYGILIILGVMMVAMLLMTIIPSRKRRKQAEQMMSSIQVGNKIKTIGGFVGEVRAVDNGTNSITLNIGPEGGPEVIVVVDKAAIYTVLNPVPQQNFDKNKTVEADASVGVVTEDDMEAEEKRNKKKSKKGKNDPDVISEDGSNENNVSF